MSMNLSRAAAFRDSLEQALARVPLLGLAVSPKAHLPYLTPLLEPGEQIRHLTWGGREAGGSLADRAVLAVTDRRILRFAKRWFGQDFVALPLRNVTAVEEQSGLGYAVVVFYAKSGALPFFPSARKSDREAAAAAARDVRARIGAPAPASSAAGPYDALRELKRMHEDGLVSEEEYAAKREKILEKL